MMAWADCGINPDTGEPMGYAHPGTCHHPGCNNIIDHGLSYVCGGMHQGGEHGCGYYFCSQHLYVGRSEQLCSECLGDENQEGR